MLELHYNNRLFAHHYQLQHYSGISVFIALLLAIHKFCVVVLLTQLRVISILTGLGIMMLIKVRDVLTVEL